MSNDKKSKKPRVYDLEERTAKFGEDIIEFCKKVPRDTITIPIISQLIRAGISVGSNYCEADCAESRKDFEHKLGICKKEAKETKHLLRMTAKAMPGLKNEAKKLWKESNELQLIFITIIRKSQTKKNKKN